MQPVQKLAKVLAPTASYIICTFVAAVTVFPFIWMVLNSLKTNAEVSAYPPSLFPSRLAWHNYVEVFTSVPFGRYFANSFFVATSVTVLALLFHSMAAYSFARLRFPGRKTWFGTILATLMVPFAITLIPSFIIVKSLGWLNTYWALIIPAIFNAFGIFLLRQFYLGLPAELEEAARLDGASAARIFWYIAVPLSRPILATLGVLSWLANWNSYLWPLVVCQTQNMKVIQVGIASFAGEHTTDWQLIMAGSTIAAVPCLLLYAFMQRYLVEGVKLSGLK
jgi:multiple sugar transport system permease protein